MGDICIRIKPDTIDYNIIHDVLYRAHESTREQGLIFHTSTKSGIELKEYLQQREGACLIAQDGDRVVGTLSYYVKKVNSWYCHGNLLDIVLIGTIPEYKGKGIHSMLYEKAIEYAKNNKLDGLIFGTAANNIKMIEIQKKHGFQIIDYHYSNAMRCCCVTGIKLFGASQHNKVYYYIGSIYRRFIETLRMKVKSIRHKI